MVSPVPVAISAGTLMAAAVRLFSRINRPQGCLVPRSRLRIARWAMTMPMIVPSLGLASKLTQLLSANRVITFWTERGPTTDIDAP
jgi:hypothetical protein